MPDAAHIEQLQEQKAEESRAIYKRAAVRTALETLDLTYSGEAEDYLTLVARLRDVLDTELAKLTAPVSPPQPS